MVNESPLIGFATIADWRIERSLQDTIQVVSIGTWLHSSSEGQFMIRQGLSCTINAGLVT